MNILKELISLLPDREQEDLCVSIMAKKSRTEAKEVRKKKTPGLALETAPPSTLQQDRAMNAAFRDRARQRLEKVPQPGTGLDSYRDSYLDSYRNPYRDEEEERAGQRLSEEDEEEDNLSIIKFDGDEYQVNHEDNTVIRIDDFSPVGVWNTETGKIDFDEDEDE